LGCHPVELYLYALIFFHGVDRVNFIFAVYSRPPPPPPNFVALTPTLFDLVSEVLTHFFELRPSGKKKSGSQAFQQADTLL